MFGAKLSGTATMAAMLIVAPVMVVIAAPAYGVSQIGRDSLSCLSAEASGPSAQGGPVGGHRGAGIVVTRNRRSTAAT
jgi:hypothetical protein